MEPLFPKRGSFSFADQQVRGNQPFWMRSIWLCSKKLREPGGRLQPQASTNKGWWLRGEPFRLQQRSSTKWMRKIDSSRNSRLIARHDPKDSTRPTLKWPWWNGSMETGNWLPIKIKRLLLKTPPILDWMPTSSEWRWCWPKEILQNCSKLKPPNALNCSKKSREKHFFGV